VTRTPTFIITRDRISYAARCWYELSTRADLDIHVVDHGSTYPPMLRWLDALEGRRWVHVHRFADAHPRDLWKWDGLWQLTRDGTRAYLVTDCDVVPDRMCPRDWVARLHEVLTWARTYGVRKVGLGLRIDNIPEAYEHRERVQSWESEFWRTPLDKRFSADLEAWNVAVRGFEMYAAPIDTTLALYAPLTELPGFDITPALRLGFPYVAQHMPWYEPEAFELPHAAFIARAGHSLNEELAYYREHALPGVSHWNDPDAYAGGD